MNKKFTFGSLFAGIGGLDLGLERAGMQVRWQVETDEYAQKVLKKHWPDVARFRDVRDCGAHNLERVDLICGGFPCQPVSSAGKHAGVNDPRWLWPEFHRIIRELEPQWVLAENVRGLLSNDNGRTFAGVLGDLAGCGYDAWWRVLSAAELGAPHKRDRVFIMAHSQSKRTMPIQQSGQRHGTVKSGQNVADAYGVGELQQEGSQRDKRGRISDGGEKIPHPLRQRCHGRQSLQETAQSTGKFFAQGDHTWTTEPKLGRVAYGISHRVDRLRCLGNAVVPQVAQWIGEQIIQAHRTKQ